MAKKQVKENVIGLGEVTGHRHIATGKGVRVFEDGSDMELQAPHGAVVTHEEHKAIEIPAGVYEVGGVLEYDPAVEEAREVRD